MKGPVYVRELSRHTSDELAQVLQLNSSEVRELIRSLAVAGVLSAPLAAFGDDEEGLAAEPSAAPTDCYQFTWVGIALFRNRPIVVYPKYINKEPDYFSSDAGRSEIQQVLRVIRKGSTNYSSLADFDESSMSASGRLALMLALISSFGENGVYTNYLKVNRRNGNGAIDWERTIASYQPFLSGGTPIYFDYETIESSQDLSDYVTRLHRSILTRCSKYLEEVGLAELLSVEPIELSAEDIEEFGDRDYVLYRLEQERSKQFITWKQNVIDMLRCFIANEDLSIDSDDAACLGTPVFQNLWEDACQVAFGNQLDVPVGKLGIDLTSNWAEQSSKRLIDLIPHPSWTEMVDGKPRACGTVQTLVPDVISIMDMGGGDKAFCIYDAKYYTPTLGKRINGVPGVESVTKQILYQRAYRDFIRENEFKAVANVFLVPTEDGSPKHLGGVEFSGVFDSLGAPFADGVEMWALPARYLFDCYLRDEQADYQLMSLVFRSCQR